MKGLPAIAASYERVDAFLGNLRDSCEASDDVDERDRVAREQELNDQAWFVLAWGQLETEIDDACREPFSRANRIEGGGIAEHGTCSTRITPD